MIARATFHRYVERDIQFQLIGFPEGPIKRTRVGRAGRGDVTLPKRVCRVASLGQHQRLFGNWGKYM